MPVPVGGAVKNMLVPGAALTRVALTGCTVSEIASITGHNFKTVQEILGKHDLGRRPELAEATIKKLDAERWIGAVFAHSP